jgi:hypothetical protein
MKKVQFVSIAAVALTALLTVSALAGTVCVYNDSGRSLNLSIVWEGGCSSSSSNVKSGESHWFSCNAARSARLRLQWEGYEPLLFNFEGITRKEGSCAHLNSLTIHRTEFGYKWRISDGKGW